MKRRTLGLLLVCGVGLTQSALGCAAAPASTASDDDAPVASTLVDPNDDLGLRPSTIDLATECWAQIERPFPADLVLKIGTPITLRTGGPICPEGVSQKLAYRFYLEKVDKNGNILAPRVSPQGPAEWSFTKSPFDTSELTPGRYRVYMFSLPRTMVDAWKANDTVARNRSTRSGNAYVTFVNTDWATGAFGACSESCGVGTQTRSVTCTDDFGGTHPDSWCTQTKPEASQGCEGSICCDVACASGDRVACGAALNEALGAGGKIRVCPGEYEGPFPLTANVEIIGSGSGNNPAVDTILVGKAGLGSVVPVTSAITAVLDSLRITGGNGASANSGGVYVNNGGADVTIDGCALVGNTGSYGGGASVYSGKLTIADSEISGNTASHGGGIATATQSTITSTRITGNTASTRGGGVFVNSGTATLGADVIITENTSNGGAGTGGGIYKFSAGATINNSASVTNNAPDDCAGNGFTCP